jgi:hypothetical protein
VSFPAQLARPAKLTHAQTILYEIDMLKFAASSFQTEASWSAWRNLECFLLHFRNLIEFFGKPQPRGDDLNIGKPELVWPDRPTMPNAETLSRLRREDLWIKYEGPQEDEKISRYLQHCTEQRVENKTWNVREMFEELSPLLDEFEGLLPDRTRPWGDLPNKGLVPELPQDSQGTGTVSTGPPLSSLG